MKNQDDICEFILTEIEIAEMEAILNTVYDDSEDISISSVDIRTWEDWRQFQCQ